MNIILNKLKQVPGMFIFLYLVDLPYGWEKQITDDGVIIFVE